MSDDYSIRPDNKPPVSQNIFDGVGILNAPVVVPRESKVLARRAVASAARDADDCRELLDALGLLDIDTLPEAAYE